MNMMELTSLNILAVQTKEMAEGKISCVILSHLNKWVSDFTESHPKQTYISAWKTEKIRSKFQAVCKLWYIENWSDAKVSICKFLKYDFGYF